MRHDIQFLRGIAVLSVLLYHAQLGPLINGYLGVDMFFVVSGFLITKIILRGLSNNTFLFGDFYLRRAKRLLPALYCTLIFTTLAGYIFLTPRQWDDYENQFIGAMTFTANLVLPFQVGYFEDAAETKPLLHIWSLSLEEQYYFFLPLFLFVTPEKYRGWALSIAAGLSFILCLCFLNWSYIYWRSPNSDTADWAFYLLPTRAWELLAGSLCAYYMLKFPAASITRGVKLASLGGLAFLLCVSVDDTHPRGNALLATFFTCVMILGQDNWLHANLATKWIERIGDWSYSLYLVHWPILAFAQVSFLGITPPQTRVGLLVLSIGLSYYQYKLIEQKFRYELSLSSTSAYRFYAISTLVLLLLPALIGYSNSTGKSGTENFEYLRRTNYGLSSQCGKDFGLQLPSICQTDEKPRFAVWGDSFAMHLVQGLKLNPAVHGSLVQITKSMCGPITEISIVNEKYNRTWAEKCIEHNDRAFQYILSTESIKYVILSSQFSQYFKNNGQSMLINGEVMTHNKKLAVSKMLTTIQLIFQSGKTPIIFSPPPSSGFNIGDCLERVANHRPVFGRMNCNFPVEQYREFQHDVRNALAEIESLSGATVIWLDALVCNEKTCRTRIGQTPLYRDAGHLTYDGSELLLSQINFDSITSALK